MGASSALAELYTKDPAYLSVLFTIIYCLCHVVLDTLVVRGCWLSSKQLASLDRTQRIYITGKLLSTLNAFVVGTAGWFYCIYSPYFNGTEGIFHSYPPLMTLIFSSYVGYTGYDMLAMYFVEREHWSMWLHHLIGGVGAYYTMVYQQASYFPIYFTISELSVPSTNWVWYLRTIQSITPERVKKDELLNFIALAFRALSFFVFRSFLAPLCLWQAWDQVAHGQTAAVKLQTWQQEWSQLPWPIAVGTVLNVTFLGTLNFWWTLKALNFSSKSQRRKRE